MGTKRTRIFILVVAIAALAVLFFSPESDPVQQQGVASVSEVVPASMDAPKTGSEHSPGKRWAGRMIAAAGEQQHTIAGSELRAEGFAVGLDYSALANARSCASFN